MSLHADYPWTTPGPLIACSPMRMIATAPLVAAVTRAGGIAFLGAGESLTSLAADIRATQALLPSSLPTAQDTLPFGIGFLLWGLTQAQVGAALRSAAPPPAAVWLFAPKDPAELAGWAQTVREATAGKSKVWIQVGTVAGAVEAVRGARPDVLVVQGQDAGGHGLHKGAGLLPLLPEVVAAVQREGGRQPRFIAAGGVVDGTTAGAAVVLGAEGVVLGTRLLATPEANIKQGYRDAVLRARDGGVSTVRTHVYDHCRGITQWPDEYGGRGVVNCSFWDHEKGLDLGENKKLYDEAMEKGDEGWHEHKGRMTTYAGTGVGLITEVKAAEEVVKEIREGIGAALKRAAQRMRELEN